MNKFLMILVLLALVNCKKNDSLALKTDNEISLSKNNNSEEKKLSCYDILKKIVESSDLDLSIYKNNYHIRIENLQSDSIKIQLYTDNNLSDNPSSKQLAESTIAWLVFIPNSKKLINITSDPQHPISLNYKHSNLDTLSKVCGIKTKKEIKKNENIITENTENCKKIQIEMGSGEECIIKNSSIKKVYEDLIINKKVDDSNLLPTTIPNIDKEIKIDNNGLISIEYKIQQNKIEISMLYEGGLTEILIEQQGKNIKRSIIYNAD